MGYLLKRFIICLLIFLVSAPATLLAAPQLETYNPSSEARQAGVLVWRLNAGKCTEDLLLLPNGNILLTAGSKQMAVSPQGQIIWENKGSGNFGQAIIDPYGSIYAASGSSILETLPNGAKGWSFSNLPMANKGKKSLLYLGPDKLLYLPLADALYALDTKGHYVWSLFPWDYAEKYNTKASARRVFLAGAADERAFYVVYGEKADFRLAAVDRQGKFLWSYWLGDITRCELFADGTGRLYASVSYKKSATNRPGQGKSKLLPGKILCFRYDSNRPVWEQPLKIEKDITAPVLYQDIILVTANSEIKAFNAQSGSYLWDDRLLKLISPVAVNQQKGRIYAGSSEGYLYAVKPLGRMMWERKLDGGIERAPLITPDGTIYVITNKGSLYKIRDTVTDN
ncbi:Quinoprotein amine dehydrogenase, beta chain-like [Syntrophomonas zehnderi OL-4]|uniref:Quinoprotein amine dehydrogenase, beta chain-like n=1 Tax=Syntrophomonas zehnderi OL-4 TaxID=690567 RepID=A0A0E4GBK8_9FIRM|nr:PQQ-binding-like beta-propeller repeat protein [Syntrophomonas zehnderi]CFX89735.1 Quinoprotein amine dehydrogenase, beta chain-like [Syntrophomonas zehnderi OL-4]